MNGLAITIAKDLTTAWALYVDTREYFMKLTEIYQEYVPEWFNADRAPKLVGGEVKSIYRHFLSKGDEQYCL